MNTSSQPEGCNLDRSTSPIPRPAEHGETDEDAALQHGKGTHSQHGSEEEESGGEDRGGASGQGERERDDSESDEDEELSEGDKEGGDANADDDDDGSRGGHETAYYTSASALPSDAEDGPPSAPPLPRRASAFLGKQPAPRYSTSPSPCPSEFDEDTDDVEAARKSRVSILDQKRSGNVRDKLVKRVERMRKESESRARI